MKNSLLVLAFFTLSTGNWVGFAQNAVISKLDFSIQISTDVDFWDDDSEVYQYENADKRKVSLRTVDTLFAYAQGVLEKRLRIDLDEKTVAQSCKMNAVGKLSGFPNEKIKDAVAKGKYDKYLDIDIQILSGGSTTTTDGPFAKKKQKVDMIVEITVFDKSGKEAAHYKKRTRMDEVKHSSSLFGFSNEATLTGNEVFALFVEALDNALTSKK